MSTNIPAVSKVQFKGRHKYLSTWKYEHEWSIYKAYKLRDFVQECLIKHLEAIPCERNMQVTAVRVVFEYQDGTRVPQTTGFSDTPVRAFQSLCECMHFNQHAPGSPYYWDTTRIHAGFDEWKQPLIYEIRLCTIPLLAHDYETW
jgi:hypothetical protein